MHHEHPWRQSLREGLVTGGLAAVFSSAALALAGRRDSGSAVAPMNAVSHWLWGDEALRDDAPSWGRTGLGLATNALSAVFWAVLYARAYGYRPEAKRLPQAIAGALATSAAAAAIDYNLVPKRLTPGFEHRLQRGSLVAVFGSIAAGILVGSLLLRDRD